MGIKHGTYSLLGEYINPITGIYRIADALVLDKISDVWTVFYIDERGGSQIAVRYKDLSGNIIMREFFDTEEEACEFLYEYYKWYVSRNPRK